MSQGSAEPHGVAHSTLQMASLWKIAPAGPPSNKKKKKRSQQRRIPSSPSSTSAAPTTSPPVHRARRARAPSRPRRVLQAATTHPSRVLLHHRRGASRRRRRALRRTGRRLQQHRHYPGSPCPPGTETEFELTSTLSLCRTDHSPGINQCGSANNDTDNASATDISHTVSPPPPSRAPPTSFARCPHGDLGHSLFIRLKRYA
jgi:hypothetical protein